MTNNDHPDLPFAPAAARNAAAIEAVLAEVLPPLGTVLEVASGTGQHMVQFANRFSGIRWQPTDVSSDQCGAIDERVRRSGVTNVQPAICLDAGGTWSLCGFDAALIINLVHIVAWSTTLEMFSNLAQALRPDGLLYLYGPYKRDGAHTSAGNERFDQSLRAQDPNIGIRDLEAVVEAAEGAGFTHQATVAMPANNCSVVFSR